MAGDEAYGALRIDDELAAEKARPMTPVRVALLLCAALAVAGAAHHLSAETAAPDSTVHPSGEPGWGETVPCQYCDHEFGVDVGQNRVFQFGYVLAAHYMGYGSPQFIKKNGKSVPNYKHTNQEMANAICEIARTLGGPRLGGKWELMKAPASAWQVAAPKMSKCSCIQTWSDWSYYGVNCCGGHAPRDIIQSVVCDGKGPVEVSGSKGGTCANGELLEPAALQIEEDMCGECNRGYVLVGHRCDALAGSCDNGALVAQGERDYPNHCSTTCDPGYFAAPLTGDTAANPRRCHPWGGVCLHGEMKAQAARRHVNHCEECDAGWENYGTEGAVDYCGRWDGECANGEMLPVADRRRANHCGWCNDGFALGLSCVKLSCAANKRAVANQRTRAGKPVGQVCETFAGECAGGELIAAADRRAQNHCGACAKTYQGVVDGACVDLAGTCEFGTLIDLALRTQPDQCDPVSCESGYHFLASTKSCVGFAGTCENGKLIEQEFREYENHCGSCNEGFAFGEGERPDCSGCPDGQGSVACSDLLVFADGTPCVAGERQCQDFGGECANGELVAEQALRTQDDQCGKCNAGFYLDGVACKAWEGACADGVLVDQVERTQDDQCATCDAGFELAGTTCVACGAETWSAATDAAKCAAWTVCKAADGDHAGDGVSAAGTTSSDVVCTPCTAGTVSLTDDSYSTCFKLGDQDSDGRPDLIGYTDRRTEGARSAALGRVAYDPLKHADTRDAPGADGAAYDVCPFDTDNDSDGDSLCVGATPKEFRLLAESGHQDLCPNDPNNDADQDGKCDDEDDDVVSWDFRSDNVAGWTNTGTDADGETDGVPPAFQVAHSGASIGVLAQQTIAIDYRVERKCEADAEQVVLLLESPVDLSCAGFCESHQLTCGGAVISESNAIVAEDQKCAAADVDYDDVAVQNACATQVKRSVCRCVAPADPVKVHAWSGGKTCSSCFTSTAHDASAMGTLQTSFKIKRNTFSFLLKGGAGRTRYVKLTVGNADAVEQGKASSMVEYPSSSAPDAWYPVEWDLTGYIGEKAVLEVADEDPKGSISVDQFSFFNSDTGCLPTCMSINAGAEDGETVFRFEDDTVPYRQVKAIGVAHGVYCRAADVGDAGSKLGPGIEQMGREQQIGEIEVPVMVTSQLGSLSSDHLPRCLQIHIKGSHLAISVVDPNLGDSNPTTVFAYAPTKSMGTPTAHCVYPTFKPRCLALTKPAATFKSLKHAACRGEAPEKGCIETCITLHCSVEDEPCGKKKGFQDCAACCESNDNQVSGCFRRRRRRLGAALAQAPEGAIATTHTACAGKCLNTDGCIGFLHEKQGSKGSMGLCTLTGNCDWEQKDEDSYTVGPWNVLRSLSQKDLKASGKSKQVREKQYGKRKVKKD